MTMLIIVTENSLGFSDRNGSRSPSRRTTPSYNKQEETNILARGLHGSSRSQNWNRWIFKNSEIPGPCPTAKIKLCYKKLTVIPISVLIVGTITRNLERKWPSRLRLQNKPTASLLKQDATKESLGYEKTNWWWGSSNAGALGKCGVPLYCHRSQLESDPEW